MIFSGCGVDELLTNASVLFNMSSVTLFGGIVEVAVGSVDVVCSGCTVEESLEMNSVVVLVISVKLSG